MSVFLRPFDYTGLQETERVLPSKVDAALHSRNGLNAMNEFRGVVTGIDLPRAGLVPAADYASIENSRSIRAVEKECRKSER